MEPIWLIAAREAEDYRRMISENGWSQRELSTVVGKSQSQISKRLAHGGYWPQPLKPVSRRTDPRWPPPPDASHTELKWWCAHLANTGGWAVGVEHKVAGSRDGERDRSVDIVVGLGRPWRAHYAIEVKVAIKNARELAEALQACDQAAERLGCIGLVVARSVRAGLGSTRVLSLEDFRFVLP